MSQIGNGTLPKKQIQSCTEEEIKNGISMHDGLRIKLHMMSFVVSHISLFGGLLQRRIQNEV